MYTFPEFLCSAYESLPIPLVYFEQINGNAVPLLVSDGFCRQMDLTREQAMQHLAGGQFETMHPDDAGSAARIGDGFKAHKNDYDILFRSRHHDGYHYIHAVGEWQTMPDGTELAVIIYTDMSRSEETVSSLVQKYKLFQQDHFYTDPLTGLPNINYMHEFAGECVHALRTSGKIPVLVYLDVNSMQSYNNQYGFQEGDNLLTLISRILRDVFKGDLISRGADDHFIILTDFTSRTDLAEQIRLANQQIKQKSFGNTTGLQAGICVFESTTTTAEAFDHTSMP
ncbi:MAG: GGDEF domain-containing protein [Clostridia bacterium]|nr:GGDEF domain-containing protein [Clostridia bacterium]